MGYYVEYSINTHIKAKHRAAALAAINALHAPEMLKAHAGGSTVSGGKVTDRYYSWTANPPPGGFTSLEDALSAWRFDPCVLPTGDVEFSWSGQKLGDEEILFRTLAPFLEDGTIDAKGEDSQFWRFEIEDGEITELQGRIEYY